MKGSLAAMLRALVLPYGATTGRRIVLDGVNGVINIYNTAGNVVATIDATGVKATGDDGSAIQMATGGVAQLLLLPPSTPGVGWLNQGFVVAGEDATAEHRAYTKIVSPMNVNIARRAELTLTSSGLTQSAVSARLRADTVTFVDYGSGNGVLLVGGSNGRVSVHTGGVEETWKNAVLLNGWILSGSSNGMRYRKVASPPNEVEIRGVITSPNPYKQIMFNVPAPYRPVAQQSVWAWTGSGSGQLAMIQPNGDVPGFGNSGVATDWWIAGTYPLD